MLIRCSFSDYKCSGTDFEPFISDHYGIFYKFNSGKIRNRNYTATSRRSLKSPGKANGLSLNLFLGYPNLSFGFKKSSGIILFISNSTSNPLESLDGVCAELGTETNFKIEQIN